MKSVRWRVIVVALVLLIALFRIFPTIKWVTLSDERKEELEGKWEELKEVQPKIKELVNELF